ncbi:MAG: glycosyltransferase, partial [Patescibacteria group bacterium]|nr:glycosyltransferase [Patescibacteria group bacterium]
AKTIGLWVLRLSDKVVLLHEGLIKPAKKMKLNYQVIHNGVDFNLLEKAKPDLKIKKNIGHFNVIYAGRLESVKGYEDYLQVAQIMIKKYKNINFYAAGNIIGKDEIIKQYQSDRLTFLGHRNDIYSVLKRMDIFVLPSYSEGLPNALMESMALGLACVSSQVGGVKYLLKDNINGFTFDPGNQKQLQTQLEKLIRNQKLIKQFGARGKELIFKKYNLDICAKKLRKLLADYA